MDGWLAQLCTKNNIEVVAEYEQSLDPVAMADDLTSSGWCLGMVLQWLRFKRRTEDFWYALEKRNLKSQIRFIMARQKVAGLMGSASDVANKMQVALAKENMRLVSSDREDVGHISAQNLYMSLSRARGRFISVVIGGPGGSHILGILVSQTQLVFFDPNAGEFVFPMKAAFRAWLPMFLTGMNYFDEGLLSEYQMDAFS